MKMSLSRGKTVKRILVLFLVLAISGEPVCAAELDGPKDEPTAAVPDELPVNEGEAADTEEGETSEKKKRMIVTEEEVTKICGEVFSLTATLKDTEDVSPEGTPGAGDADSEEKPEDTGDAGSEEKPEDTGNAGSEEKPEDTGDVRPEGTPEGSEEKPEDTENASPEEKPEDVSPKELQYESENPEIAVIEEAAPDGVKVRAVQAGDTVIKITAPETELYDEAQVQVLLHITPKEVTDSGNERDTAAVPLLASNLTSVENAADGISLKWGRVEGAKGYYLERSTNGKSPWSKIKTAANVDDITFVDTQVTEGDTYYYRVRVFGDSGQEGLTGASKKIVRLIAPVMSVGIAASSIELKWNRVKGCSGYYVYRREPAQKDWTEVSAIKQPGEISWRDTAAENGKTYIYTVRAYKGSSLSPYAGGKSYVRIDAPALKSFKRKSSTKYKLTWKTNALATGYQIQYAQNGMFVGAKKVTVKSAKKSSYTLSKLQKKKKYYVRIRAYKKDGGTTYFSGWTTTGNVKKTRTTTVTPLTKKKKVFEIRTWAKQKMYKYDTLQGSCTDGKYAYYLLYNRKTVNCKLVKVKRSNLKVVKVSGVLDVAHGNDMTYDSHKKRLVIVHSTGVDPKRLTSVDPNTLGVIESKHVQIPKKLAGGSLADAAGATAFSGLAYSSGRKQYAVLLSHNYNFVILDSELDPVRYVKVSKKNNYVVQGIDATDDYIMLAQSPKTSKQKYNIITVYDWDGKYISKINVKKGYEIESIYHVGSKYYAGFYRSYYRTRYKDVEKTVKVDGKEKKKKVKVKYREYQRDNYVYQIKGI